MEGDGHITVSEVPHLPELWIHSHFGSDGIRLHMSIFGVRDCLLTRDSALVAVGPRRRIVRQLSLAPSTEYLPQQFGQLRSVSVLGACAVRVFDLL